MRHTVGNHRRATLAILVAALSALGFALLAGGGAASADAGARTCANADATLEDVGVRKMRRAVSCLINAKRTKRGRRALRPNGDLNRVARKHTKVMLRKNCFTHQCRGEAPLRRRIVRSGYVKAGRYGFGENLGCSRTPAGMVNAWMDKRFHRRNIMDRGFRHFGIGAKRGAPRRVGACSPRREHVTYTVLFGWRKR